jgi:Fe-S oxidoreductase
MITTEIAKSRLGDARDVNVEVIITSCPFCILNLNSACLDSENVFDLADFVLKSLKNGALDG